MTRTINLPTSPDRAAEAADVLCRHLRDEPDDDRAAEQLRSLAWRWAQQASAPDGDPEATYWRVLDAAGIEPSVAGDEPSPQPERQPAPQPTADPEPQAAPEPEPAPVESAPESEPLPSDLTARLRALAQRVESEPTTTASPVAKWDPDETPIIAGEVAAVEWADLRQRGGPVRIVTLRTEGGPAEAWASWQQLAALLRQRELAHGRPIRAADLLAIQARGRQRVGRSRSPSRMFALSIEWADQP